MQHYQGTLKVDNMVTVRNGEMKDRITTLAESPEVGVKVISKRHKNKDVFYIYVTDGKKRSLTNLIGTIHDENFPKFTPIY